MITDDILEPRSLTIPQMTTVNRNAVVGKVGLIIYDSTQDKLCFKKDAAAAASSWEIITSVEET